MTSASPFAEGDSAGPEGTSDRVGTGGEEVWLQSLGSDPQTSEDFQTDPHLFGEILTNMFLFSDFKFKCLLRVTWASPVAQMVKSLAYNMGDPGLNPGSGRSPGEGHGIPLHILAWRIPWREEPGRLQSTQEGRFVVLTWSLWGKCRNP